MSYPTAAFSVGPSTFLTKPTSAISHTTVTETVYATMSASAKNVASSAAPIYSKPVVSPVPHIPPHLVNQAKAMYAETAKQGGIRGTVAQMGPVLSYMVGTVVVAGGIFALGRKIQGIIDSVPKGENPRTWRQKVTVVKNFIQHAMMADPELRAGIAKAHEDLGLEQAKAHAARQEAEEARAREVELTKKFVDTEEVLDDILDPLSGYTDGRIWEERFDTTVQHFAKIQRRVYNAETDSSQQRARLEEAKGELEETHNHADSLQVLLDREKAKVQTLRNDDQMQAKIESAFMNGKNEGARERDAALNEELSEAQANVLALRDELEQEKEDAETLKQYLTTKNTQLENVLAEIEKQRQRLEKQEDELQSAKDTVEAQKRSLDERQDELRRVGEFAREQRTEVEKRDKLLRSSDEAMAKMQASLKEIHAEVAEHEELQEATDKSHQEAMEKEIARRMEVEHELEQLKSEKAVLSDPSTLEDDVPQTRESTKRSPGRDASPVFPSSIARTQPKESPMTWPLGNSFTKAIADSKQNPLSQESKSQIEQDTQSALPVSPSKKRSRSPESDSKDENEEEEDLTPSKKQKALTKTNKPPHNIMANIPRLPKPLSHLPVPSPGRSTRLPRRTGAPASYNEAALSQAAASPARQASEQPSPRKTATARRQRSVSPAKTRQASPNKPGK